MNYHYRDTTKVAMKNFRVLRNNDFSEKQTTALASTTMESIHVAIKPVIKHNNQRFQQVDLRLEAMNKKIDNYQQQTNDKLQSLDSKLSHLLYTLLGCVIGLAALFISAVAFLRT